MSDFLAVGTKLALFGKGLGLLLSPHSALSQEIVNDLVEQVKENIEMGGDPSTPLSEAGELTNPNGTPLMASGALYNSIEGHAHKTLHGVEIEVGVADDAANEGTNLGGETRMVGDYAAMMEFGGITSGAIPDAVVPPRPFLMPAIFEKQDEIAGNVYAHIGKMGKNVHSGTGMILPSGYTIGGSDED